jgi:hypothetical protein
MAVGGAHRLHMGTITTSRDDSGTITVFSVSGDITGTEITEAMARAYQDSQPVHALWDYVHASFHRVDSAGYARIAEQAKSLAHFRSGGRTAFVAPGDVEVSAIKLLEAISQKVALPIPLRMFNSFADALDWLRNEE